jgi:queuine/archaeosine tRNA-ribosyltransferase
MRLPRSCHGRACIGIGGVVPLLRNAIRLADAGTPERYIAAAVSLVRTALPLSKIHVFGAGGPRTFPALYSFGADSADSIAWRHAAGFGSVFLPFKSQRAIKWNLSKRPPRKVLDEDDLAQLAQCACPICGPKHSLDDRITALVNGFHNRSIHNAWMLTHQMASWPSTRRGMASLVANGKLGLNWA